MSELVLPCKYVYKRSVYVSAVITYCFLQERESCGLCKYSQNFYAFLIRFLYFVMVFIYECFVVH